MTDAAKPTQPEQAGSLPQAQPTQGSEQVAPHINRGFVFREAAPMGVAAQEFPMPRLTAKVTDRVLVEVKAVGINPVDAKGNVGDKFPLWMSRWAKSMFAEGKAIGFDFSGVVREIPKPPAKEKARDRGLRKFEVGDEVFGTMPPMEGAFKNFVLAPTHQINLKPRNLSFAEAATVPLVGLTAYQSLKIDHGFDDRALAESARVRSILIVGASGGVGHVAVQVARALGAKHVVGVCSARNADFVRQQGADFVVDYSQGEQKVKAELEGLLKSKLDPNANHEQKDDAHTDSDEAKASESSPSSKASKPFLFDLCLDCVSSLEEKDKRFRYIELLQPLVDRKYLCIGGGPFDWIRAGVKRTLGLDLFLRKFELFWVRFPHSREVLGELAKLCDAGELKPTLLDDNVLPFSEEGVREAFSRMHSRRTVGKIALKVGE